MMRRVASVLTGTRGWRGYALAAVASAMLAAGAVCGTGSRDAAPTAPSVAPPSAVDGTPTVTAPPRPTMPPLPVRTVVPGLMPPLPVRTAVPGLAKGGLFADGVTGLASVSTAAWKTYTNAMYGFTFRYPADWQFSETDSAGHHGPNGEPAYPLHSVSVKNPATEQGKFVPGENCYQSSCIGPPPGALGFYVAIWNDQCGVPGDLVVADTWTISGKQGSRCVLQSQNDGATRFTYISFPLGDGINFLTISLERGRSVSPSGQAVLETVLLTFAFTGRAATPVATP